MSPYATWFWLTLPSLLWLWSFLEGGRPDMAGDVVNPTGALSAFLLIFALSASPLQRLTHGRWGSIWLVRNRRYLGVASFGYGALHTFFYLASKPSLSAAIEEISKIYIWTGWASLFLMVPLALTSNNTSVKRLRKRWKPLQRLAYPAALIGLLHIVSLHDWENPWEPLLIATPLIMLQIWRAFRNLKDSGLRS